MPTFILRDISTELKAEFREACLSQGRGQRPVLLDLMALYVQSVKDLRARERAQGLQPRDHALDQVESTLGPR